MQNLGKDARTVRPGMLGRLVQYSVPRRLAAFLCEPTLAFASKLDYSIDDGMGRAILFVPGLTDGFFAIPYIQPLADAAAARHVPASRINLYIEIGLFC